MDLTLLKFEVDTSDLDSAIGKFGKLEEAVDKFNNAAAGAGDAGGKAGKGAAGLGEGLERAGKGAEDAAKPLKGLEALFNKIENQYKDLVNGFTKGESAILNQARALGASEGALKQFEESLKRIKELTKDPFDQSIGALRSITAEFDKVGQRAELMAQGISLSNRQLEEFSRISSEVKGKIRNLGFDPAQGQGLEMYNRLLKETQADYLQVAYSVNKLTEEEKQRNKVLKDQEKQLAELARANMTMMDQAVAEFRKNEQQKADAAERAAKRIIDSNNDIAASIQRINSISKLVEGGMSQGEATRRTDLSALGIEKDKIEQLIAAEQRLAAAKKATAGETTRSKTGMTEAQKASAFLEKELRRIEFALEEVNNELQISNSNRLLKFKDALKAAGHTAAEQEQMLNRYSTALVATQKRNLEAQSRAVEAQMKDLSRSVSVQMGDVAVSLASGMNPFMVMIQQGDQLRGAFEQSTLAAEKQKQAMVQAAGQIAQGFIVTGKAVGTFFAGALEATAGKMLEIVAGPGRALIQTLREGTKEGLSLGESLSKALPATFKAGIVALAQALPMLFGTTAVAIGATVTAYYQLAKAEAELSRNMAMSGAQFGVTTGQAKEMAKAMTESGESTISVINLMSKVVEAGNLTSDSFELIKNSAMDLDKYVGVPVEKTVEVYSKLANKPSEALSEIAVKTGMVSAETLESVRLLEEQGDKATAAALAFAAYGEVATEASNRAYNEMEPINQLWIDIKSKLNDAKTELVGFATSTEVVETFKKVWQVVAVIIAEVWFTLKGVAKEIGGIAAQAVTLFRDGFAAAARMGDIMQADAKAAREEHDKYIKSILDGTFAKQKEVKLTADQLKLNSDQAKIQIELDKGREKSLSSLEKYNNEVKRLLSLNQKATPEQQVEIQKQLKNLTDDYVKSLNKKTDAEKESDKIRKEGEKQLDKAKSLLNGTTAAIENQTKAEKMLADIRDNPNWSKYSKVVRDEIEAVLEKAKANEILVRSEEVKKKKLEELRKEQDLQDKNLFDSLDVQHALNKAVNAETESLQDQIKMLRMTDEERKRTIAAKQAQLKLDKELLDISNSKVDDTEKDKQREEARNRYRNAMQNVNTEIALDYTKKMISEFEAIKNGISDSIVTALFEGGKAGRKKLRDLIVAELKKPITLAIKAVVNPIMDSIGGSVVNGILGNAMGSVAGQAASSAGGAGMGAAIGSLFGAGGLAGSVAAGAGWLTGATTLGGSLSAAGSLIGTGSLAGATSGLGMLVGSLGPIALGIGAIAALAKSLDNSGTVHTGASSSYSVTGGLRTGEGVYGVGADQRFGGAYSKETEKLTTQVSKTVVDILNATASTFGKTGGFSASAGYADDTSKDGAWGSLMIARGADSGPGQVIGGFGSEGNGRWPGKSFADGEAGVKQYTEQIAKSVRDTMNAIGLPSWATKMLNELGDTPTLEDLGKVVQEINATHGALQLLGDVMPQLTGLSDEAAEAMLAAAGGASALVSTVSSYYENFFSEEEKIAKKTDSLTEALAAMGIAMPADRLAYRAKVEEALAAGNEELAVKLMQLSGVFAELNPILEGTTDEVEATTGVLDDLKNENKNLQIELMKVQGMTVEAETAFRNLATQGMSEAEVAMWDMNRALQNQIADLNTKTDLEKQLLQVQGNTVALRQMELDKLSPANQEIQKLIWSLEDQAKVTAEAEAAANALAQEQQRIAQEAYGLETQLLQLQGNTLALRDRELALLDPTNQEIQKLIWSLEDQAKVSADAARAAEELAQKQARIDQEAYGLETRLLQLQGNTLALRERELAELDPSNRALLKQIFALEDQKAAAEAAAKQAEEQANAARQAAEEQARAAEAIRNAWQSITDSIYDEVKRIRGLMDQNSPASLSAAQGAFDTAVMKARAGDQDAAEALPELSQRLLELAQNQAKSSAELRRIQLITAGTLEMTANKLAGQFGLTIPAYASGGSYAGGLALVGEQGPELINFNSAGRIYDAKTSAAMMNNSRLESLVEKLNDNIEGLRYEVRADVSHNAKTAKLLDRVIRDGETVSVTVTNP